MKIQVCNRTGYRVYPSNIKSYSYQCLYLDEDLYNFETKKIYINRTVYSKNIKMFLKYIGLEDVDIHNQLINLEDKGYNISLEYDQLFKIIRNHDLLNNLIALEVIRIFQQEQEKWLPKLRKEYKKNCKEYKSKRKCSYIDAFHKLDDIYLEAFDNIQKEYL